MKLGLFVAIALGSAGACARPLPTLDGQIDLEPTGGLAGDGDGSPALHIAPDGAATRDHHDGRHDTASLGRATVADLRGKIADARFDTLAAVYDGNVADDFADEISVVVDGSAYTVIAVRSASPPAELRTVIDTLTEIRDRPIWH